MAARYEMSQALMCVMVAILMCIWNHNLKHYMVLSLISGSFPLVPAHDLECFLTVP